MVKIRNTTIQNGSSIDRLSDLPDFIVHHILSFLDARPLVQTSVLSKRWKSLWKYVDALNFSKSWLLSNPAGLERFVEKVVSLRSDCSRVTRVTWDLGLYGRKDLVDDVLKYAASHGIEELYICSFYDESRVLFGSIWASYQSLKVLKLDETHIRKTDVALWSCFQLLETLTLTRCRLVFADAATDAFANFPRLETLKLVNCQNQSAKSVLKVTGLKLLRLEIVSPVFHSLEIVAPKLQSFTLKFDEYCLGRYKILLDVSKSNLPSLNLANIELCGNKLSFCANLFEVLRNVQALRMKVDNFKLLIRTCNLVKHQPSPFKRLKSVNVMCPAKKSKNVPDEVMQYFLGGSPYKEEDKSFIVQKLRRRRRMR
ncbi:F-box/LRR-repeat protein 25 [Linum grandiflorum]